MIANPCREPARGIPARAGSDRQINPINRNARGNETAEPAWRRRGNPAAQTMNKTIAMYWQAAAADTYTWKTSWKPKTAGIGLGQRRW